MKKKKFLFIIVLLSSIFSMSSQSDLNEVTAIFLEFNHSRRIPNGQIQIQVYNRPQGVELRAYSNPLKDTPEWEYTKVKRTLSISKEIFQEWYQQAQKLKAIDIENAIVMGADGNTCSIEFGGFGSTVTYKFWSPSVDNKARGLSEFLELFKKILSAGGFNPEEIL